MKPTCDRVKFYPLCIEDPTGGACPPFTCRALGLGFGAWTGWRVEVETSDLIRYEPSRLDLLVGDDHEGLRWGVRPFAAVTRLRCTRVTRSRRTAGSQRKAVAAAIPQPRRKIKA